MASPRRRPNHPCYAGQYFFLDNAYSPLLLQRAFSAESFLAGNGDYLKMRGTFLTFFFTLGLCVASASSLHAQEGTESDYTRRISAAHQLFGRQCDLCHGPAHVGVTKELCARCHAGPVHNAAQTEDPECRTCHAEHEGQAKLAQVANQQCVSCHADLQTKPGHPLQFAKKVSDFIREHPQFSLSIGDGANQRRLSFDQPDTRRADTTQLTFPHEKHLRADLKRPAGEAQLKCQDCHAPAANGRQMAPISYLSHCQRCHPLSFDPQFPNRVVPHAEPPQVHAYLIMTYAERRPDRASAPPEPTGRLTRPVPSVSPIDVTPSVARQVADAEKYLYYSAGEIKPKGCDKCHALVKSAPLPTIEKTAIPSVWFPHARFAHKPHRMVECAACHADAAKSTTSTDISLPGIQVCQECHRASGQADERQPANSATTECVSCHLYHPRAGAIDWSGSFTIPRLLTEGQPKKTKGQPAPTTAPARR